MAGGALLSGEPKADFKPHDTAQSGATNAEREGVSRSARQRARPFHKGREKGPMAAEAAPAPFGFATGW